MLGVLGGMGPLATIDFLDKLVRQTRATRDQDHLPFVVASLPQTPDRTEALLGGGPSPLPAMLSGVDRLIGAGADLIAIACNTAHAWHGQISAHSRVPVLHIVEAVLDELRERGLAEGDVGLLATTGTLEAGVYRETLSRHGFRCRPPRDQGSVMSGVLAVKAGKLDLGRDLLATAAHRLLSEGCRAVILGCTEVPVALAGIPDLAGSTIDSSASLARSALRCSGVALSPLP